MEDRSVFLYFLRGVPTKYFCCCFLQNVFYSFSFFLSKYRIFLLLFFCGRGFPTKKLSDGSDFILQRGVHSTLYTLHSTLYTLHSTLYITVYIMQDVYCYLVDGGGVGYREMSLLSTIE
jgi:hypothetical protein